METLFQVKREEKAVNVVKNFVEAVMPKRMMREKRVE